jgi:hypothetical protein
MFAKNLEQLFIAYCDNSDFLSPTDAADVAKRFDALRGCAKIPRGRDNREEHLSVRAVSFAVLGLVPSRPAWAGQGAIVLGNLLPAGGKDAAFRESTSLLATVELILSDQDARDAVVSLIVSAAEDAINANGIAWLTYRSGQEHRRVRYVPRTAVSLLQPGAENKINRDTFYANVSRCAAFSGNFFRQLAGDLENSLRVPGQPAGDGSEYDAEEAAQARNKALRVQPNSSFLNVEVETQATWPSEETLITFEGHHLVLMPRTKENAQSIHVDLTGNRVSISEARTIINRFLSAIAWSDDQYAVARDGWAGNPVPVAVPRRKLGSSSARLWFIKHAYPASNNAKLALALYREGLNAEESSLSGYAVLSYFKIVEIQYPTGPEQKKWIGENFESIETRWRSDPQMKHFMEGCGTEAPTDYIYKQCRVAVAHASVKRPLDVDEFNEIQRLYSAAYVLRLLARQLISQDLGVPDQL